MRHSITHNVANSATKLQIKCRIAKENPKITHILRRYSQQTAKRGSGVSKCQSVKLISAIAHIARFKHKQNTDMSVFFCISGT